MESLIGNHQSMMSILNFRSTFPTEMCRFYLCVVMGFARDRGVRARTVSHGVY